MCYPYAFFVNDYETYIESENWSMPCRVSSFGAKNQLELQIKKWPDRETSLREEFNDWINLSNAERKKIKRAWFNNNNKDEEDMHSISLADLPSAAPQANIYPIMSDWKVLTSNYNQNQEGNNPMCYQTETTSEASITKDQRKFLLSDLYRARDDHQSDLHSKFHMDPVGPKNIEEMIEWIKADKFEYTDKNLTKRGYLGDFFYITKWVDKENPAQVDAHAAATEKMNKAYKDAERVIKIKSPEAGLDALTAFEAATFH